MRRRRAVWIFLIASAAACLIATALYLFQFLQSEENTHFELDETKVVVVDTTDSALELYKAGADLDSATPIVSYDRSPIWLPRGDYYLVSHQNDRTAIYPINIHGYRAGPEEDGSLALTIRKYSETDPPAIPGGTGFAFVPSGYFLMGDRLNPNEPHYVWTQAFFIGQFEVTNAEFSAFLHAEDGYNSDLNWSEAGAAWKRTSDSHSSAGFRATDPEFSRFGQSDMPVTGITWFEAVAYCRWLTAKYGGHRWLFSLPSEAEWEKAARGPDGFDYPLGHTISDAEASHYNWKKNPSAERTLFGVEESRSRFRPNRYGLFHLGGNVVEWTQSIYKPISRLIPYSDDDDRNRDALAGSRVARGGSWYSASAALLYIAYRDAFEPELSHHDLGFRIVAKALPL